MRIIGGKYKGRAIRAPKGLPVRPTTDFAKEGLFNILNNRIDFTETKMLDLFCGTGHIALEFASRGSTSVTAVDMDRKCISFLSALNEELNAGIALLKSDVFGFLRTSTIKADLIFADPPYDMENIEEIHSLVFERELLNPEGWLILEHGPRTRLSELDHFYEHRKYGNVNFSFFRNGTSL